ncbi:MAG: ClpXP protease specificity-enhancing factor [Luteimonas sp.]
MTDAASPRMTSHRPYLLRALYEWIADNGMTPHVLVDATRDGVRVPPHTVKDGKVVLNIADRAVAKLELDNDSIRFTARFGGVSHPVLVPIAAVLAIYARETGQGMALPDDIAGSGDSGDAVATTTGVPDDNDAGDGNDRNSNNNGPDDDAPPPRRGHLRVVK